MSFTTRRSVMGSGRGGSSISKLAPFSSGHCFLVSVYCSRIEPEEEREVSKMQTRRTNWMLVTSLLIACLSWGIAPSTASGQSYGEIVHRNECTRISNAASDAMNHHQWESLVSLARQFVGNCLDLSRDSKPEAELLNEIAIGLDEQGKFDRIC